MNAPDLDALVLPTMPSIFRGYAGFGGGLAAASPAAGLPRDVLETIEAVLNDSIETDQETREFVELVVALMIVPTVQARIFDPESGVLAYLANALERTTKSLDRSLR